MAVCRTIQCAENSNIRTVLTQAIHNKNNKDIHKKFIYMYLCTVSIDTMYIAQLITISYNYN